MDFSILSGIHRGKKIRISKYLSEAVENSRSIESHLDQTKRDASAEKGLDFGKKKKSPERNISTSTARQLSKIKVAKNQFTQIEKFVQEQLVRNISMDKIEVMLKKKFDKKLVSKFLKSGSLKKRVKVAEMRQSESVITNVVDTHTLINTSASNELANDAADLLSMNKTASSKKKASINKKRIALNFNRFGSIDAVKTAIDTQYPNAKFIFNAPRIEGMQNVCKVTGCVLLNPENQFSRKNLTRSLKSFARVNKQFTKHADACINSLTRSRVRNKEIFKAFVNTLNDRNYKRDSDVKGNAFFTYNYLPLANQ